MTKKKETMDERYEKIVSVGGGTFGVVWKAVDKQTHEVVAVKKLIEKYDRDNKHLVLREIKALKEMGNHPNIVKLKKFAKEHNDIYMVFEYMDSSLYRFMLDRTKNPFSEDEIREMCFQLFQGLSHMHRNGYFHRDLKPDNLLVSEGVIKIGDLGSTRNINDPLPYTDYVTTRWYRAPEVLLGSTGYEPSVDMWAMGVIMAELFTFQHLFDGSSQQDMIDKICKVLGTPTESTWSWGVRRARKMNIQLPDWIGVEFSQLLPYASPDAVNLISSLLSWDPFNRPTALEALQHPFFNKCNHVARLRWHNPDDTALAKENGRFVFEAAIEREMVKQQRRMSNWIYID
uniref:cyclin-dependent kinase F-4-like n=1 Tax=Erigeron canadensis TaxID=72917 RepID=UPI001CB9C17A|nr:cyclin-dependent kinase F-4-like [Erigeron canadensis]